MGATIHRAALASLGCMILSSRSPDALAFTPSLSRPLFSFHCEPPHGSARHSPLSHATPNNDGDPDDRPQMGEWRIPNEFKMFLTQCSVQSFMFLLRQMRDPQTVFWLERFTQPALIRNSAAKSSFTFSLSVNQTRPENEANLSGSLKLSRTNGTASALETLKQETKDREKQSSKLLQYHGLAAMNTTLFPSWEVYFADLLEQPTEHYLVQGAAPHIPEYELEIDPKSLCSRLISVREQIAREFVRDLQVIADMGGHTLESYWETLRESRDVNSTTTSNQAGAVKPQRENLLFLELSTEGGFGDAYLPSPLRRGNFDLLVLLSTQEAIHCVLNDKSRRDGPERVTNEFLANFYSDRMRYFTGVQKYGRADDFLEELLSMAPRMINIREGVTSLIDPTRITELILEEREAVAMEWKQQAEESPQEHMVIQKMRLNRMMDSSTVDEEKESFQ